MNKINTKKFTSAGSFLVPAGVTAVRLIGTSNAVQNFNNASAPAAGNGTSLVLKTDGSVWSWGLGTSGALGNNTITSVSSPVLVVGNNSFIQIYSKTTNTLALRGNDGSIWSWGVNTTGQLGDNTVTAKSSPVSVLGNRSYTKISTTNGQSAALQSNGGAWCWGANASGTLGDNTSIDKSSPVSVVGNKNFSLVCMGNDFCMALQTSDGSAWTWGGNGAGQQGRNSIVATTSPNSVLGSNSYTSLNAYNHTLAIRGNDGSLWAWGTGTSGQLGNNAIVSKSSPISVVGNISFTQISAGINYSLGINGADGSLWAWGLGTSGQLGDNTLTTKSSPVSVVGNHSFSKIWAGGVNSMATKSDGTLWIWGAAASGALGDSESTVNQSSPIMVINQLSTFFNPVIGNNTVSKIFRVTPGATITVSIINGTTVNNPSTGAFFFFGNEFVSAADSITVEWME